MKYIDNTKLKIIIFSLFLVAVLTLLYFTVLKPFLRSSLHKNNLSEEMIVTEMAPLSRLYDSKEERTTDLQGNLIIKIAGREYMVMPDGSVWQFNEDGNIVSVDDPLIITKALIEALKSDTFTANQELVASKIDLKSLTEDEIKSIAEILGVSEKDLKDLVLRAKDGEESIKTVSDAIKLLDLTTYSDGELKQTAIEIKTDYKELKDAVEEARANGTSLSIADFLKTSILENEKQVLDSYLQNLGREDITSQSVLDMLEEQGKDFQDFMQDVLKQGAEKTLEELNLGNPNKVIEGDKTKNFGGVLGTNPYNSSYLETPTSDIKEELSFLKSLNSTDKVDVSTQNQTKYESINQQDQKASFLKNTQTGTASEKITKASLKNMITAGTVINATLGTGINTDLPGQITAIVSQNVYDHFSVTNILIPKGSVLVATYDSAISFGQDRVLIAWQTLIRPDGVIVKLNGYQGIDRQGFAGQEGEVENHILEVVASSAMASLISASIDRYSKQNTSGNLLSTLLLSSGNVFNDVAKEILSNAANRQPTIKVEGGTNISVLVNDNVELPTYKE